MEIINWTNENSGFLSLVLFIGTLIYGWLSGFFKSIIKKPKLKVRFIEKMSFYSFYYTGEKWIEPKSKVEYNLHKTGFVVYMSIANIGEKPTSIDKISIGYQKNTKKSWFKKNLVWLHQWHSIDDFTIEYEDDNVFVVRNLRTRNKLMPSEYKDNLGIGESTIGVAYFEQETAWGNLNPNPNKANEINVTIRIIDIYDRTYKFNTVLKKLEIKDARKHNKYFGNVEEFIKNKRNA